MSKRRTGWVAIAALLSAASPTSAQPVAVEVDSRVELVSALFRAGGRPEYRRGAIASWNLALDSVMAAHSGHPALAIASRLAGQYNVGFLAPISLAIHLDPRPLALRPELGAAPSLHRSWTSFPDSTRAFVASFESFRRDARFDALLDRHRGISDTAAARLARVIVPAVPRDWFRRFWRDTTVTRVVVAPGLTTGRASYGLDVAHRDGSREAYAVIGVSRVDAAGLPQFEATDLATVVHEMHHPYVTAALRGAPAELRRVADSLHRGVATEMRAIGYGSGDAMLNEALVRAAVIRFLDATGSTQEAAREIAAQRAEGFRWIEQVVAALAEFERDRGAYPTFRAYVPRLIERLRELVARGA